MNDIRTPAELRALIEKMTPGPWTPHHAGIMVKDDREDREQLFHAYGTDRAANCLAVTALRNKADALVELWAANVALDEAKASYMLLNGRLDEGEAKRNALLDADAWRMRVLDRLAGRPCITEDQDRLAGSDQ